MPADKEKYGRNDAQVEYAATADAQSPTDQVVYFVNGERRIYVPGSDLEKRMVRKIDLHMFTCVCILYLLNYLDRQNIGNAKVAGMQDDLKLSSSDYSVALLVFFPAYLLGEIPSNLILTRVKPSIYLPGITMVWGVIATLMSQVQTKESLIGVRFVLGFVESGFFCGVVPLPAELMVPKNEMSRRMAYLYAAAILSGAFGGLLAGGVIDGLEGARGIRGWRWLFIIEGALTVFFSIIFVFVLPNWPANTSWLTEEEKALADARIRADRVGTMGASARMSSWNGVLSALSDWRMYLLTLMYMTDVGAGTITYFIPTLTTNLGFTGRAAQWMTVPVYIVTLVVEMILAYSSDYFNERAFHIAIPLCISGIMYALSIGIANHHAQYVFLWCPTIILAWTPNVINYPKREACSSASFCNMVGNLASVYGAYLWPASDAPRYKMGLGVTSAMCFISSICAVVAHLLFKRYPFTFNYTRWGISEQEEMVEGRKTPEETPSASHAEQRD